MKNKLLLLMLAFICSMGMWAAPGDEIKSPNDVVSGKSYYIKGIYTASKVDYTVYYGPTETDQKNQKVQSAPVTDIKNAMPITFTKVATGWVLTTPKGNYIRPHSSNGQTYFVEEEIVLQLASGDTKEGTGKGIKIGPWTPSGSTDNWYIQSNKTSAKIGAYKNTQYDVTLIEAEDLSGLTATSLSFSKNSYEVNLGESFTAPALTATPSSILSGVTYSSTNTDVAEVNASTGAVIIKSVGTTTIKATFAETDVYKGSTASYILYVVDPNVLTATFDLSANKYGWSSTSDGNVYFDGSTYSPATEGNITLSVFGNVRMWGTTTSSLRLYGEKAGTDPNPVYEYGRGSITFTAATGYVITKIGFEGSNLTFQNLTSGVYNNSTWSGNATSVTLEKGSNTPQIKSATVSYRKLASHDLAIHANGWSSLALDFNAEVPEGTTAYYASASNINGSEGTITLTSIPAGDVIPAKAGVIIKGAGTVTFVESTETPAVISNIFSATPTEAIGVDARTTWVLNSGECTPAKPYFSLFTGTEIPAHKAYLDAEKVGNANTISFAFEDDNVATSISTIENVNANGVAYNLAGQRVSANTKGIVIINGHKYINK